MGLLALTSWTQPAAAARGTKTASPLRYELSLSDPASRYVQVELELEPADRRAKQLSLAMPAWTPGSYLIRDFGKHVYRFEAHMRADDGSCGAPLPTQRLDKQTWQIDNQGRAVCVSYEVYANELSVRTSYVDDRFAFLNGSSVFMYPLGETSDRPVELRVNLPADWPVHTPLDPLPGGPHPSYQAPSYDELVDSPLLLGEAEVRRFEVAGRPLEFVYLAPGGSNASVDRLARDAEIVVRSFARILGGLPFERYSFLMVGDPIGGGGLEHHDSTGMIVDPGGFAGGRGYASAQRLVAHEFFHLWNVKRIHDQKLGPFDYARETYSDLLWFHEGFTETMETRALLRAGVLTPEQYLAQIASAWTSYAKRPGRNFTPISELSREAWIKAYKHEPNHSETTVSYYQKGNLIGLSLDLAIRLRARAKHTGGSLDGLFRRLWAQRDPSTGEVPITIDEIVAAASAEAGDDMRWFFERYVYGTEELPLPQLLEQAGFVVELQASVGREAVWSGMGGYGATLASIEPDSPAARAGLAHGDELIAVDGARVESVAEANERLRDRGVGASAKLSLFRRERLLELELTTAPNPHTRALFALPEDGDGAGGELELHQLRTRWLYGHLP